jgi:hypothetical protein
LVWKEGECILLSVSRIYLTVKMLGKYPVSYISIMIMMYTSWRRDSLTPFPAPALVTVPRQSLDESREETRQWEAKFRLSHIKP